MTNLSMDALKEAYDIANNSYRYGVPISKLVMNEAEKIKHIDNLPETESLNSSFVFSGISIEVNEYVPDNMVILANNGGLVGWWNPDTEAVCIIKEEHRKLLSNEALFLKPLVSNRERLLKQFLDKDTE